MERRDEMNLDVNDVLALMRKYLPRGRWLLLNSEFFGPLFSLSHYIGVSPAGIERVLEPVQWFQHMLRGADKWLHKPTVAQPIRDKALVASVPRNYPVWIYVDLLGTPQVRPEDQLDCVRVGWEALDDAEREKVMADVANAADGRYGRESPEEGWGDDEQVVAMRAALRKEPRSTRSRSSSPRGSRNSSGSDTGSEAEAAPTAPTRKRSKSAGSSRKRAASITEQELSTDRRPDAPARRESSLADILPALKVGSVLAQQEADATRIQGLGAKIENMQAAAEESNLSLKEREARIAALGQEAKASAKELTETHAKLAKTEKLLEDAKKKTDGRDDAYKGDLIVRARQLGTDIKSISTAGGKLEVFEAFYKALTSGNRRANGALLREVANANMSVEVASGATRVVQPHFNIFHPRARAPEKSSTRRDRSER